ncbi:predicted protein [Histoplasma capsulatum H143]|uniref:Uncharacterized protein n=1 Tax=Ajellomyces capsulatus (strain H143) TaxID=544712 RepID=C6HPB5_AJECH|nr:predicted protein [Histoplasma capsulatum H143]
MYMTFPFLAPDRAFRGGRDDEFVEWFTTDRKMAAVHVSNPLDGTAMHNLQPTVQCFDLVLQPAGPPPSPALDVAAVWPRGSISPLAICDHSFGPAIFDDIHPKNQPTDARTKLVGNTGPLVEAPRHDVALSPPTMFEGLIDGGGVSVTNLPRMTPQPAEMEIQYLAQLAWMEKRLKKTTIASPENDSEREEPGQRLPKSGMEFCGPPFKQGL